MASWVRKGIVQSLREQTLKLDYPDLNPSFTPSCHCALRQVLLSAYVITFWSENWA